MSEHVGFPIGKVILKKRQFQFALPTNRDFDLEMQEFATGFGTESFRDSNIYYEPSVGAIMVAPLWANRGNYLINSPFPDDSRYQVSVPNGAPPETINEIKKRVWRSKKGIGQEVGDLGNLKFSDYKEPWEGKGNEYLGPIWEEELHEPLFTDPSKDFKLPVSWLHQKQVHPNVEWFVHQEYGNFTNESFWMDVVKYNASGPDPEPNAGFKRNLIYGKNNPLGAYFALRIGWSIENPKEYVANNGIGEISNYSGLNFLGPFDLVFPIGEAPFIWDHQGDTTDDESAKSSPSEYSGYVANRNTDPSWILRNEISEFRIICLVMKGKLIIRSTFSNSAWVFPINISDKANEATQKRYENFFIPPGKVCVLGRGFAFRFNYNPLEFNIYDGEGVERKPHALLKTVPLSERKGFGGWKDIDGGYVFTKIPYSRGTRTGDSSSYTVDDLGSYGQDIVTVPFEGHGSGMNTYTSMLIPVSDPRELVLCSIDPPEQGEDLPPQTNVNYGFETQQYRTLMNNGFFTIRMQCRAPSFGGGGIYNTNGISKRFASPVLWRIKAKHDIPKLPRPESLDITRLVKTISYNNNAQDYFLIREKANVEVVIPKDWQGSDFGLSMTRDELLDWLQTTREIEIWLGWLGTQPGYEDPALIDSSIWPYDKQGSSGGGQLVKIMTGIARSGPKKETFVEDTITLNCEDRLSILEGYPIINSPIFDGMNVDKAFLNCAQISGLPTEMFDVVSNFADRHILPMSFQFDQPRIRFNSGTTILAGCQKLANFFQHVIRTQPDGTIILTDIYSDALRDRIRGQQSTYQGTMVVIDDLQPTHESYKFYIDGTKSPNPFQRVYEYFSFDKNVKDQVNQIQIFSVDRSADLAFVADGSAFDISALEDPDSPNFIGYLKPVRIEQPAFGTMAHIEFFRRMAARHMFRAPLNVRFTTYGRPTIRSLDIIEVEHEDTITARDTSKTRKYRVIDVNLNVDLTDKKYAIKMDIEAESI